MIKICFQSCTRFYWTLTESIYRIIGHTTDELTLLQKILRNFSHCNFIISVAGDFLGLIKLLTINKYWRQLSVLKGIYEWMWSYYERSFSSEPVSILQHRRHKGDHGRVQTEVLKNLKKKIKNELSSYYDLSWKIRVLAIEKMWSF